MGWWVATYNFTKMLNRDTVGLPLMAEFSADGKQLEHYIQVPTSAIKSRPYVHLLNDNASLADGIEAIVDTRDGSVIVSNTNTLESYESRPLSNTNVFSVASFRKPFVHQVCSIGERTFEVVVTDIDSASSKSEDFVLTLELETKEKNVKIVSVDSARHQERIGPGFVTKVDPRGNAARQIVRMVYKEDGWFLARKLLP